MTIPQEAITIEPATPLTKATILIDMSSYDLFELCPCRYNYGINQRRHLTGKKNENLDKGGVLHEGFEVYYKLLQAGKTQFQDRVHEAVKRVQFITSDHELSSLEPEEAQLIINTIEENLEFWRAEDETLTIHAVEEPFVYLLYEDEYVRILISGKIDLLVDKPGIGNNSSYTNLPLDHKSFSRDFPVRRLTNQFQNYALACGSPYLVVNRVGLQKTLKPYEKYRRVPLSYDDAILEQWKINTIEVILNRYLPCVSSGIWPMNLTSCDKYNRPCEYLEVCDTAGEKNKIWKLENNYVVGDPWDVTKKLERSK